VEPDVDAGIGTGTAIGVAVPADAEDDEDADDGVDGADARVTEPEAARGLAGAALAKKPPPGAAPPDDDDDAAATDALVTEPDGDEGADERALGFISCCVARFGDAGESPPNEPRRGTAASNGALPPAAKIADGVASSIPSAIVE